MQDLLPPIWHIPDKKKDFDTSGNDFDASGKIKDDPDITVSVFYVSEYVETLGKQRKKKFWQ